VARAAGDELLLLQQVAVEGDERRRALDDVLVERAQHAPPRRLAVRVPGDQLRDHRVVDLGDLRARPHPRVDADAGPRGLAVGGDAGGRGQEARRRVLGVDAALEGVAPRGDLVLGDRERLAGRYPHLLAHEVEAGHDLGDGVLHLDARVHLEEEELVARDQVLQSPGRGVADRPGGADRGLAHPGPQPLPDDRARRLLDQLLVAALHRAVALPEPDAVAVGVGEDLDLDVARLGQVALQVDRPVGEEALALAPGALEGVLEPCGAHGNTEALAAPACRRLDGHGVADLLRDRPRGGDVRHGVGHARDDRDPGGRHQGAGAGLGPHGLDGVWRRADPDDPRLAERPGEARVLGQEAVARVHGLGARLARHLEDAGHAEVALARRPRAEQVGLVGVLHEERVAVDLAVDGDRGDAHLAQGPHHADGDLAPVGHQHLGEHQDRLQAATPSAVAARRQRER
jgi:hypothetical protein